MTTLPGMPTPENLAHRPPKKGLPPFRDARSRLDPTRIASADRIASTAPKYAVSAYFDALASKSRVKAIKFMCWQCCSWDRHEVALCTAKGCPLWAWRPFQAETADA